jgi:peptide/nickel transport system permease protein
VTGDLGESMRIKRPVSDLVLEKLPVTLQLATMAFVIALLIGIPAGVISAVKKDTAWDVGANLFALWGLSTPNFWLGILFIFLFSVTLGWLPASGFVSPFEDFWRSIATTIMPAFVLGNAIAAVLMRHMRSAMLQAMSADYVRTARAKGAGEPAVVGVHAVRNALIPVVTVTGLNFASLLSGAVLTESVFAWPGIGRYAVTASTRLDYPAILGVTMLTAVVYIVVNLLVDVLYGVLDPRIRVE